MLQSLENSLGRAVDAKVKQGTFLSVSDDAVLGINDSIVHVTGFSGAVTITLPFVSNATGRIYVIKVLDDASVNNITVEDNDDSRNWSDLTLANASGGKVLLWSDGEEWHQLQAVNVT